MSIIEARAGGYPSEIDTLVEYLGDERPKKSEIIRFVPNIYLHPEDEHHGLRHTMNTIIVADTLFALERKRQIQRERNKKGYTKNDRRVLLKAVSIHDSHHSTREKDFEHGLLAASWISENLDDPDKEIIAKLVRDHVPADYESMSHLLKILKDADSLERVRAPLGSSWYLNTGFLRTQYARNLIDPLKHINEVERRLAIEGFVGDGTALAIEAFTQTGWIVPE